MNQGSKYLVYQDWAMKVAAQAGELIRAGRDEQELEKSFKDGVELVTQMDLAAEDLILAAIRSQYPDHKILSEESASDASAINFKKPTWIVDPIDGTVNYAHRHPQVGISIALADQGELKMGVVYNPFTGETFHAVKGIGAYLNDVPIKCSSKTEMAQNLVATGFPYEKTNIEQLTNRLSKVLSGCADIRRLGSAALDMCWVACGRLDSYFERDLKLWDMAAGWVIAKEAGVTCGHIHNHEQEFSPFLVEDVLIGCTEQIYSGMQGILQEADAI